MLKQLTLVTVLLVGLLGCATPQTAPHDYKTDPRVLALTELVNSNETVVTIHSTASLVALSVATPNKDYKEFYKDGWGAIAIAGPPVRGMRVFASAHWQHRDERYGRHYHLIEVWHNRKVIASKEAEGIDVSSVGITF